VTDRHTDFVCKVASITNKHEKWSRSLGPQL
jgi:hypothetical protein